MVSGICKSSVLIQDPLQIDQIVDDAFLQAISGRPGPVWLDVPIDVQATLPEDFSQASTAFEPLFSHSWQ